jgi:uridine phosphorylase
MHDPSPKNLQYLPAARLIAGVTAIHDDLVANFAFHRQPPFLLVIFATSVLRRSARAQGHSGRQRRDVRPFPSEGRVASVAVGVPSFGSFGDKSSLPSCYSPAVFLDALQSTGWAPGPVPPNVVYTYAHLEFSLAAAPHLFTPNHMLGSSPNTFFLVNEHQGSVGVNCLPIGAPGAVNQLALQAELGVQRFLSVGTCGGLRPDMAPGDVVLVSEAVRDEGTSRHFLAPDEPAVADAELTSALRDALGRAGIAFAEGTTWTMDVPFRETADEILHYRAHDVATIEMEAAAIFAAARYYGVQAASVLVVDSVADDAGTNWRVDLSAASARLRDVFAVAIDTLGNSP